MSRLFSSLRPFHHAFPVHDITKARHFYGYILGFPEGRSAASWVDFNCFGHQIVCHLVQNDYKAPEFFNPVDADDVPVPHFGVVLSIDEFKTFSKSLEAKGVQFNIPPHIRFAGQKGEQWTMFFKDPSGNALEFKAMTHPDNLFSKYFVQD